MMERLRHTLQTHVVNIYKNIVRHNSNRTGICHVNRSYFVRTYPTMVVLPNGSTINVRYNVPRAIVHLPIDLSKLTPEERQERLRKRNPKKKRKVVEDIGDDFNINKYRHLFKKK